MNFLHWQSQRVRLPSILGGQHADEWHKQKHCFRALTTKRNLCLSWAGAVSEVSGETRASCLLPVHWYLLS